MPQVPTPVAVESTCEAVVVLYRDLSAFEIVRTPEWATEAADSVVPGSEVRLGKRAPGDDWNPQAVIIPGDVTTTAARRHADEILHRIAF